MNHSRILPLLTLTAALVLVACPKEGKEGIGSSTDCFMTPDTGSVASFANQPIPANTFGEGSEEFAGEIPFHGNRQNLNDTCVERLDDVSFDESDSASTGIRLKKLDLVGSEAIVVKIGDRETRWNVKADLSEVEPPVGKMQITRANDQGGTWEAEVSLHIKLTFTPEDGDLNVVVLDTGERGMEATVLKTQKPVGWAYTTTLAVQYDEEAGYTAANRFVPAVETIAGVQQSALLEHRGERWGHISTLAIPALPVP